MVIEDLKKRVDRYGEMWGCHKHANDPACLGWITVSKRRVSAITPVDPREEPERFAKWQAYGDDVRRKPYLVNVYEVDANANEAEINGSINYMAPEDYKTVDNYYLSSLDELPDLLIRFGKSLDDLIPQSELMAP